VILKRTLVFLPALFIVGGLCQSASGQLPSAVPEKRSESRKEANVRTWTDSTGKHKVEAEFVELKDGKVQLRKADGAMVRVPVERLSEADRAYIGTVQKGQGGPRGLRAKAPLTQPGPQSGERDSTGSNGSRESTQLRDKRNWRYLAWCGFKPGSTRTEKDEGDVVESEKRVDVLKSVTDSKVVIERTKRRGFLALASRTETVEIPAVDDPDERDSELVERGTRTVEAAGRSFECEYRRFEEKGSWVGVREIWTSTEVPGGIVLEEVKVLGIRKGDVVMPVQQGGRSTTRLLEFKTVTE